MENLRITNVTVKSNVKISVEFSHNLTKNLTISNINITSDTAGVPDSQVLKVTVKDNILNIDCLPLTPLAYYIVTAKSTTNHPFQSINGDAFLFEDGISNKYSIQGPIESDNAVNQFFKNFFKDNIYNIQDTNTLISKLVQSYVTTMSKALNDIGQVKNENYLSFTVTDEEKVRGSGPYDRLNEESAYEILRVGKTKTNGSAEKSTYVETFPLYPITLQKQSYIEQLSPDSVDDIGVFNINSLVLNLTRKPVTKLTSLKFTFVTPNPVYTYNIETLGYQILDSRYDQDYGFTYLALENNQIKLSESILQDENFSLDNIYKIDVEYEYKNEGIYVDKNTISVTNVFKSNREITPPIINVFSLDHAPVVDVNGDIPKSNGVTFIDPSPLRTSHPAFIYEIPFRFDALPNSIGQYSVDYTTGTVYVYGEDNTNSGTGAYPPLATYYYEYSYEQDIDYSYDEDLVDLVALPKGSLIDTDGYINFSYEQVLVPDVDYIANLHKESLNERINNNLLSLNSLRVKNAPITNTFRIYNETSGEIYPISRWNNDKIYFKYNTPPAIKSQTKERATFAQISNEYLFVTNVSTNLLSLRVFKFYLNNNTIISATEDGIGSSLNSSVFFSDQTIFVRERWFDRSSDSNVDILSEIGDFCIDYTNGIIYCAVSSTQDYNVGTVSYKYNSIQPQFPHLISVEDIYYQINSLSIKNKNFTYTSFEDNSVVVDSLEYSDELYLNETTTSPYQVSNKIVGVLDTSFVDGLTNSIKNVRGLYEYVDVQNNPKPLNFATFSEFTDNVLTVNPIEKSLYANVQYDGYDYYVLLNDSILYESANITFDFSVIRQSDGYELWDNAGTFVVGDDAKLILPLTNSPADGDYVLVSYTITINDLSRVVVDYNKGDFYIDYTYLFDEILVSYEYGDNVLDFRESYSVSKDETYYVTYKVGALRDALANNFGSLINIEEINNIDASFDRERYRDALTAALASFVQGPTVSAIKNIGKTISHIEPELKESLFDTWSLGNSLLTPKDVKTTGEFKLLPAKYGNGTLIDSQTVKLPASSNLRLNEGTFEQWIIPNWDGIDNDATLTFSILEDGYDIETSKIFLGAEEKHPDSNSFSISKSDIYKGSPNKNKDGIFIYYDLDSSGDFYRWYCDVVDGYTDGYVESYKIKITSNGSFYDTKSINLPKPSNISFITGVSSLTINITGSTETECGVTFISDVNHYLFDVGKDIKSSRLSLYKDISGYFVLKAYDKRYTYSISHDVSSWKAGEQHHVAAAWKINKKDGRDELHLFIDGFEVPNNIYYGNKKQYVNELFRTINPDEFVASSTKDIIGSTDLVTTQGSSSVTSSINFSSYNISPGDILYVEENGFDENGYTISSVSGQTLVLSTTMPYTLTEGKFSVNKTVFEVFNDTSLYSNIIVTTLSSVYSDSDLSGTSGTNTVTSATDFSTLVEIGDVIRIDGYGETSYSITEVNTNTLTLSANLEDTFSNATFYLYKNSESELYGQRALVPDYSVDGYYLSIRNNVLANDLILVKTLGLNHRKVKKDYYVWSDNVENIIMTQLPTPIDLDKVSIKKIILPSSFVGPTNSTYSLGLFNYTTTDVYNPVQSQNGRTLAITIGGTNVDFSTTTIVSITGLVGVSTVTENVSFSDYGTQYTTNLFGQVYSIDVVTKPTNSLRNALTINVKEKYSMFETEYSGLVPVIKYSYPMKLGYTLYNDGYDTVRDDTQTFSSLHVNNYIVISQPSGIAGYYKITGISEDRHSLTLEPTSASPNVLPLPDFTDGYFTIVNVVDDRTGLQNGFFTFEDNRLHGQAYYLTRGFYELEYYTYASINFDVIDSDVYFGSDMFGSNQINAIVDQLKIYSVALTDTRVGETIPSNQRSITKDFNSLKKLKKDKNTLVLIDFDEYPFINSADFYKNFSNDFSTKQFMQSNVVLNENFGNSLVLDSNPIVLENLGILDTKKEGTIEFWLNPIFDTANDPAERYYFDAFSAKSEKAVSTNSSMVIIPTQVSQVLSVKLEDGDQTIDYFAGGKVELDTKNAIQENATSNNKNSVTVTKNILQVISVKIANDYTNKDYFVNGIIGSDKKTIYLGKSLPQNTLSLIVTYKTTDLIGEKLNSQVIHLNKKLPGNNTNVIVTYIPKGYAGDRISIYKDSFGFINFRVIADSFEYVLRSQTRWSKGTWHRIKASYKFNSTKNLGDEMRLFVDGYQYGNLIMGDYILGQPIIAGTSYPGDGDGYGWRTNIKFNDSINQIYIGSDYNKTKAANILIDNFRISNISRPVYTIYGEPIDINYSSNTDIVYPVVKDLYTTFLSDFEDTTFVNEDFAILRDKKNGSFDFSINIFDSFGIINSNEKVKEILEKLIKVLKPANSKAYISYE